MIKNNTLWIPILLAAWLLVSAVSCDKKKEKPDPDPTPEEPTWIVGADLSLLPKYVVNKAVYKDVYGNVVYPLSYFKEQGFNYVRVRLFVNPDTTATSTACQDLAYVTSFIKTLKEGNFKVLLDFHYSDTWADPGKQYTPSAWTSLDATALTTKIYTYTREALKALVRENAVPDMIQVGNEITMGILWDKGRVDAWDSAYNTEARWAYFAGLLKNASKACREVCPDARVMLHIDRGGDKESALRFYRQMKSRQVDYDLIGLSYYPFWHGPLSQLVDCLNGLKQEFPDKPVNIVEVAYPNHEWGIDGNASYKLDYPATPDGQRQFMEAFLATIKLCSNVNGFMYWFPEETYVPGKTILNLHRGFFDNTTGMALPIMDAFRK